ncbi:MAG: hypothetical protein GVY22_17735, partial [Gammaproteobacteria bacterium]|nr:hypothetical protein [Gammaproteobacteria bacterium]
EFEDEIAEAESNIVAITGLLAELTATPDDDLVARAAISTEFFELPRNTEADIAAANADTAEFLDDADDVGGFVPGDTPVDGVPDTDDGVGDIPVEELPVGGSDLDGIPDDSDLGDTPDASVLPDLGG